MSGQLMDTRLLTVIGAIRQEIQQSVEPGLSVNSHPNPFFLSVIGSLDLRKIAERVLQRLDEMPKEEAAPAPAVADPDGRA